MSEGSRVCGFRVAAYAVKVDGVKSVLHQPLSQELAEVAGKRYVGKRHFVTDEESIVLQGLLDSG